MKIEIFNITQEFMFPIILVSKNPSNIEKYIEDFIKKNQYHSYAVFKITPKIKEITIDQIRSITKFTSSTSHFKRLFIIYSFDTGAIEAQNAFLKTLEDYTEGNQFVLIAQNEENILPTIRSRAKTVYLDSSQDRLRDDSGTFQQKVKAFIESLIKNPDYKFLADENIVGLTRDEAVTFIDEIIIYFADNLTGNKKYPPIIKKGFILKKLLINNNLNPQMTIDNFLIFIKKTLSK